MCALFLLRVPGGRAFDWAARRLHDGVPHSNADLLTVSEETERTREPTRARPCADLLPEPLPSWSYGVPGSKGENGMGSSGASGAVLQSLCSGEYRRGDAIVYVRIFEGAPEGPPPFQGILNPMTIAARGGSRERVRGREGVLVYETGTRRGELSVAIPPRAMAVVEGWNVAAEEIRRYAERIRYELIPEPD